MSDTTLSLAIKEAYSAAPSNVVIYHTLELWHINFTTPIRVVRDFANLSARLEASAPRDAGQIVTFIAFAFDFSKPEVSSSNVPQITITMDNVDRSIVANIEAAMGSRELVTVTYREFLSSDLVGVSSGPQNNPPLSMTIMTTVADVFKITATAGFPNLMNKRFPTQEYSAETFTGLA